MNIPGQIVRKRLVQEHIADAGGTIPNFFPAHFLEIFAMKLKQYAFTQAGSPHVFLINIAGDANADGEVNILDATYVGLEWGETSTNYWQGNEEGDRADLNNDCKVNILDAVIIGACWGNVAY